MNNIDTQYQTLLQDILNNGVQKKDRTGTGTISVFGRQIRHKMSEGFPLLTTKKMAFKTMVTELLWFLRGDTNIKYLVENDCHIWDGDAYKNYVKSFDKIDPIEKISSGSIMIGASKPYIPFTQKEFIDRIKNYDEFAKKWGELGPIYGKQWRSWRTDERVVVGHNGLHKEFGTVIVDQIATAIHALKTNPDDRGIIVSAWNVGELDKMVLRPCHNFFQFYTRELSLKEREIYYYNNGNKEGIVEGSLDRPIFEEDEVAHKWYDERSVPKRAISLMFNMRSNDVPLGLPFNIASYGLLLEIIGRMVNMIPDELIINLGDAHIYKNQIDGVKEQLTRTPMKLSNLIISDDVNFNGTIDEFLESCNKDSFKLNGYESHPSIKIPLSN